MTRILFHNPVSHKIGLHVRRLVLRGIVLTGCVTLCACAHTASTVATSADSAPARSASPAAPADPVYALLQQAEAASSPQRERLLLQAAGVYRSRGDTERMGRTVQEIDSRTLTGADFVRYSLLAGEAALERRHLSQAAAVLLSPQLSGGLNAADEAELHRLRAVLHEREQRPLDALFERLSQSTLVSGEASQREISESVWRLMSQLRDEEFAFIELADTGSTVTDQLLNGWVALARIQRDGSGDIDKQVAALRDWQRSWPQHPANRAMPADMALLHGLLDGQPGHIALLLPLSGKRAAAGRAVRDGFLSQYYRALADSSRPVQVDFVDTAASTDFLATYNAAVAAGAQLVIGPLEREQVQQLAAQPSLPVPTLALNNPPNEKAAPGDSGGPENLYQFSLNPEDEVRQLAEAAAASRLQRALLIVPEGERGERLLQRFLRSWEMTGGTVTGQVRYQPGAGNFSLPIAEALGVDLATGQYREGSVLPDMVFFAGSAADAADALQTLARNSAGQVPVYATAQAYGSQPASRSARLNGLRLCLTPWQAGEGPLRVAGDKPAADVEMLYAMGADARDLYLRLPLMRANPALHVPGNSGYLRLDVDRRVARKLVWGSLQDGRFQALPVVAGDTR